MNVGRIVMSYQKRINGKKDLSDEDKFGIVSEIVSPKKYIPFKEKEKYVTNFLKENVSINNGKIIYNSADRYFNFMCLLLNLYYDLDIEDFTYDKLSEIGILGYMIVLISDEYDMFRTILDSYIDDLERGRINLESLG